MLRSARSESLNPELCRGTAALAADDETEMTSSPRFFAYCAASTTTALVPPWEKIMSMSP